MNKNRSTKVPGKWRILSFLPVVNWVSLLYIGIIKANPLTIIVSIVHCILIFKVPELIPVLWIEGIIHYALAAQIPKKQNSDLKTTQIAQPLVFKGHYTDKGSQFTHGFSDISLAGRTEIKQAIPRPVVSTTGRASVSFSYNSSQEKFFIDMRRYASFYGPPSRFVPFMTYWPEYDSMNKEQRDWYFYWRAQFRQGNYLQTDLSYIFLLIYELLSGIGWQTPKQGYEQLLQLWSEYRTSFPKLDYYLINWTFDFALQNNIPYSLPFESEMLKSAPSVIVNILINQHAEAVPLKLPFSLLGALCDYPLHQSKFFKDGHQKLMQEAIPRVIALADASLRTKSQRGILSIYGPSQPIRQEHLLFQSAVCPNANKMIPLTVRNYSEDQGLRNYISELARYGENVLREINGYRGRLRGVTVENETEKLIELFLMKEYGRPISTITENLEGKEFTINNKSLEILREQSNAVREALEVKEKDSISEKMLLTEVKQVTAIYSALPEKAVDYLVRLYNANWEVEQTSEDQQYFNEINRLANHYLGCDLVIEEQNQALIEDDFRDELEYIFQNPPEQTAKDASSTQFNLLEISTELRGFIESLLPEQKDALYAILTLEDPQSELERIAGNSLTMPEIILDDINKVAVQTLGDLLLDTMEQKPRILDEYIAQLKQSIDERDCVDVLK